MPFLGLIFFFTLKPIATKLQKPEATANVYFEQMPTFTAPCTVYIHF